MATATLTPLVKYILAIGPDESDAALLSRFARTGDEAAFVELVRRHGPAVLGVCRRVLRDNHAADDAFQATFLLLAKKAAAVRQPERLANWLYGVAYRTAMKLRSRLSRQQTREHPFDESAFVPPEEPDGELGPELDAAIAQLPSKYRVPFVLCYLQGLSNAEAAARLGCPTNTVATHLSRAREQLRFRLTKQGLTVAVSTGLVTATARNAMALATGATGASSEILTLMEGVRTAMMWKKAKLVIATIAMLALTGVGATRMVYRAEAEPPAVPNQGKPLPPPSIANQPSQAKEDRIPPLDVSAPAIATKNFEVTGTTPELCQKIATEAETLRVNLAKLWLGKELPDWPKPCPLKVTIATTNGSSMTVFAFAGGSAAPQQMALTGTLERILHSQLPHEITHTVLADHFREPVPRWADEGAAILSEDETEQKRHDEFTIKLLKDGRAIRLSHLFPMKEYPSDLMTLYAQGYSVTRFLVEGIGRERFLAFVKSGMKDGWDAAVSSDLIGADVNELEKGWIDWLRNANRAAPTKIANPTPLDPLPAVPPPSNVSDPPPPSLATTPQDPPGVEGQPQPPRVDSSPAVYEPVPPDAPQVGMIVVQAVMEKDKMVVCKFPKTTFYEPVTSYVRDESGATRATTSYVRKSIQEERSYPLDQLQIIGTNGKPIDEADLAKRLQNETTVIFVQGGGTMNLQLLPLLKDGTLIISTRQITPVPQPPLSRAQ